MRRVPETKLLDATGSDGKFLIEWRHDPITGAPQPWAPQGGYVYYHGIMLAESGAAVDIDGGEIHHRGGGHADNAYGGMFSLRFQKPGEPLGPHHWKWRRSFSHPELFNGQPNYPIDWVTVGTNPDGSPCTVHTWDGVDWIPGINKVLIALGSTTRTGGPDPERRSWFFDPAAGTYQLAHRFPGSRHLPLIAGFLSYSRTFNRVFWAWEHSLMMYDPLTGENRFINGSFDNIDNRVHGFIDEPNKMLYLFLWGDTPHMQSYDLTKIPTVSEPVITPEQVSAYNARRNTFPKTVRFFPTGDLGGFVYRPGTAFSKTHGHVLWNGGNDIYVAKPPVFEYRKVTLTGDTAPAKVMQGMYKKFSFIDEQGEYAIINTLVVNDTFVFRMPAQQPPIIIGDGDMATPETVVELTRVAYEGALELAGQPSVSQQIATLTGEKDAALAAKATAEAERDTAITAKATAEAKLTEVINDVKALKAADAAADATETSAFDAIIAKGN